MNTGNPLYFRTSSRMENKNTVESIHCFTGKKHAPGSLFGYLRYWKTTKPRIWGRVSLTLISLRLDWPTCAEPWNKAIYRKKENIYSSPMFGSWLVNWALSVSFSSGARTLPSSLHSSPFLSLSPVCINLGTVTSRKQGDRYWHNESWKHWLPW